MRLLTDSQVPIDLALAIRALEPWLGWTVETVYELGIDEEGNDARLVAYARERGAVFLTLDLFRGRQRSVVAAEIRTNGGAFIQISGGPEQQWKRALSKLLYHAEAMEAWLNENEGAVTIEDFKSLKFADRMSERMVIEAEKSDGEAAFDEYVVLRDARKGTIRRRTVRTPVPPIEQSPLITDGE